MIAATAKTRQAGWWRLHTAILGALSIVFFVGVRPCASESLFVLVRNDSGESMKDAVVLAQPANDSEHSDPGPKPVLIDQIDKEFVPYVTAVAVGTRVSFPNRDQIRHHVYSFSDAKTFEIPLYKGTPAELITFDKPGEVVLGCNIHDWMKAYVFVSDAPYFTVTDAAGAARLDLPPGDYRVRVWHPELGGDSEATVVPQKVVAGGESELNFSIEEKHAWKPRRAPSFAGPDYR